MNIECVIVSVNYGDFLAHTLPYNKHLFNKMVVVTTPADSQTQRVCGFHNVQCLLTEEFYADGGPFNKGRGINAGLRALSRSDWLVHMDADVLLPPLTRHYLEIKNLDRNAIYGIDRLMCESYEDWAEFISDPHPQHELDVYVHPKPFDMGTRIAKRTEGGYIPIGFFQLWHGSLGRNCYPIEHQDAARSDMLFALQWPPQHRALIPEIFGYHLATEGNTNQGTNWRGRQTPRFLPQRPAGEPQNGYADKQTRIM